MSFGVGLDDLTVCLAVKVMVRYVPASNDQYKYGLRIDKRSSGVGECSRQSCCTVMEWQLNGDLE